jgi:protein-arginine kinase activator protein McsA
MNALEIILLCLSPSIALVVISIYIHHRDKHKARKSEGEIIAITSYSPDKENLLKELEKAVKDENYEKASQLRNRINKLENK